MAEYEKWNELRDDVMLTQDIRQVTLGVKIRLHHVMMYGGYQSKAVGLGLGRAWGGVVVGNWFDWFGEI